MKRYLFMLMIVLFLTYTLYADAEEGSIKVILPDDVVTEFRCSKVADLEDGVYVLTEAYEKSKVPINELGTAKETEKAIEKLQQCQTTETDVITVQNGSGEISGLEEGMYLVEGAFCDDCEIAAMLVCIPTCDETTGEMSYDITAWPKVEKTPEEVETGDGIGIYTFSVFLIISFIIVVRLSCHKHFKCGRISE